MLSFPGVPQKRSTRLVETAWECTCSIPHFVIFRFYTFPIGIALRHAVGEFCWFWNGGIRTYRGGSTSPPRSSNRRIKGMTTSAIFSRPESITPEVG